MKIKSVRDGDYSYPAIEPLTFNKAEMLYETTEVKPLAEFDLGFKISYQPKLVTLAFEKLIKPRVSQPMTLIVEVISGDFTASYGPFMSHTYDFNPVFQVFEPVEIAWPSITEAVTISETYEVDNQQFTRLVVIDDVIKLPQHQLPVPWIAIDLNRQLVFNFSQQKINDLSQPKRWQGAGGQLQLARQKQDVHSPSGLVHYPDELLTYLF